jgi:hypothetical protein
MEREKLRIAFRKRLGRELGHAIADILYEQQGHAFKPKTCWSIGQAERRLGRISHNADNGHCQLIDPGGKDLLMISPELLGWMIRAAAHYKESHGIK